MSIYAQTYLRHVDKVAKARLPLTLTNIKNSIMLNEAIAYEGREMVAASWFELEERGVINVDSRG